MNMPSRALVRTLTLSLTLACTASWSGAAAGQDQKKRIHAATVEEAGPDFHVQGEYLGRISVDGEESKVGCQVIARANGKFEAVGYLGGLPGAGAEMEERKTFQGATNDDGVTVFVSTSGNDEDGEITLEIRDGNLRVFSPEGEEFGQLERVVRKSPTLGKEPPEDAVVLFDGQSADAFDNGRVSEDGLLVLEGRSLTSKAKFQSCKVHLEFRLPFKPSFGGQDRANSGCYVQERYEVQILDSFGLPFDVEGRRNKCGSIYSVADPRVNMCLPPLQWQTYDIDFTAAEFDESGKRTSPPKMTVHHNGVLVHEDVEILKGETTAAPKGEGPEPRGIFLQNHGSKLRFKNIWVVPRD